MEIDVNRQTHGPGTREERALLARFHAGDNEAFQLLVRPHLAALLALGRRLVNDAQWAEDLTQETLVRGFRALAQFRGDASIRSWLFRIEIRLAAEPSRWQRSEHARTLPEIEVPDHLGPQPERAVLQRELEHRLDEAMERLTPRQRAALHLRAVEGLDYAAIAAAMGCGASAARMLVLAARRRVLDRMGGYLEP